MQQTRQRLLINFPMLLNVLGWLLMIEGSFMLVPTIVCICYNEADWIPFAASSALTAFTGMIMTRRIKA